MAMWSPATVFWPWIAVTKAWAGWALQLFHQLRTIHVSQLSELLCFWQNCFLQRHMTDGLGSPLSTQDSHNGSPCYRQLFRRESAFLYHLDSSNGPASCWLLKSFEDPRKMPLSNYLALAMVINLSFVSLLRTPGLKSQLCHLIKNIRYVKSPNTYKPQPPHLENGDYWTLQDHWK